MRIPIQTIQTDAFTMDCFRFGEGEHVFVILPGLSGQPVSLCADAVAAAYASKAKEQLIFVPLGIVLLPP